MSAMALFSPSIASAGADDAPKTSRAPAADHLQLDVWINGRPTDLIGAFDAAPGGDLSATVGELRSLGLKATGPEGGRLSLSDLPGVSARYDPQAQRLYIQARDSALIPHRIDARKTHAAQAGGQADVGAVLNYGLAGELGEAEHARHWAPSALAGDFETRLFGPFGVVTTTAESRLGGMGGDLRRLDSAWTWFDPNALVAFRAGDLISGGFDWTRPVRLGGLQVRRAFALRPDLVTMPTPSLSGSAVVPSIAEVIVNGATVLSRPVASGPLSIDNLPPVQGASANTLLLRDALGRQTSLSIPFFATPDMLKPGLLDFSAETGFARRFYGLRSFGYDSQPVGSGSLRYGLSDWATGEAHVEGGAGLAEAGAGGVFRLGGFGAATGALAVSRYRGQTGSQMDLGLQGQIGTLSFGAKDEISLGRYADLGAATAPGFSWRVQKDGVLPPKQLVQFNAALSLPPLRPWRGMGPVQGPSLGVSYSSLTPWGAARRDIWSGTLRQGLPGGASVYATAYSSSRNAGRGFFAGLSMAFGGGRSVNVGAEGAGRSASGFAEASQQADQRPGAFGWRVHAEGGTTDDLEAEANYVSAYGRADLLAQRLDGANSLQGRVDGAVVLVGGRLLFSDRINDAFAVVEAGRAHIPVMFENRQAGETDAGGRLILPYLSANNANAVSIDPGALPADLSVDVTRRTATPIAGAGVVVRFTLKAASPGILLVLHTASGVLPVGSIGWVEADREHPFIVGYDGQAYVENAKAGATLRLQTPDGRVCAVRLEGAGKEIHATPCV